MGRLIQSEFLKLSKSLGYKILLLSAAGMGTLVGCIYLIAGDDYISSGNMMYLQILSETQTQACLVSVFAALFICNEFHNRTFGIGIMSGCSRLKMLLSKFAAYIIGSISIVFVYPIVGTVITIVRLGFGEMNAELWQNLVLTTFMFIMGIIAMGSFCFMLSMLIKNVGGTIGAGIGILLVLILVGEFAPLTPVMRFSFTYQLGHVAQPESFALFFAVISATIVLTFIASRLLFERTELK